MNYANSDKTDMIQIEGEYYDPYYILQTTRDDSDEHIAKSYRKKAKKYHPDKAPREKSVDYMLKFKIVTEAYNYIRNKRLNASIPKPKDELTKKFDVKVFNKDYVSGSVELESDPNKYGYGEHKRLQKIEEYDNFKVDITNQFAGKTFDHSEFNKLFEYNKILQENNIEDVKSIVHTTSDGFCGYNTADTGSCAIVHSFNGLMVTGDDYGESGVGYWGEGYSDYKKTFTGVKNPQTLVQVPSDYRPSDNVMGVKSFEEYKSSYQKAHESPAQQTTFTQQQDVMCKQMMETLVKREKQDETFVMKYANQYKPEFVRAAMQGELEKSATLLENLQEHYNVKRIGGGSK